VITLGSRVFSGPFLAPLWLAPRTAGLFAVMVPGWRLMTFRALHFGQAGDFTSGFLKAHERRAEWLRIAGTEWNLYVAILEMPFSTEGERRAAALAATREYRPEFARPLATQE